MYPVGVLFGLGMSTYQPSEIKLTCFTGFDTASSVALLAVSALAEKGADGKAIPQGYIVILPVNFILPVTCIARVALIFPPVSVYRWDVPR